MNPGDEQPEHDGKTWPMPPAKNPGHPVGGAWSDRNAVLPDNSRRSGIPMRYVHAAMRLPRPLRAVAVRVLGRVYR